MKYLLVISLVARLAVSCFQQRLNVFKLSWTSDCEDLLPLSRHLDLNEARRRFSRFCLQRHGWKLFFQLHGKNSQGSQESFGNFWGESEVRWFRDLWQSQTTKPRGHMQENQLWQLHSEVSHNEPRQIFKSQVWLPDDCRPILRLQLPGPFCFTNFDSIFLQPQANAVAADDDREGNDREKWPLGPYLSHEPQRSNLSRFNLISRN